MVKVKDIGVLGGMFDPVHIGHLRTALAVREALELDEMRLLPCARPAHRDSALASNAARIDMLRLAVQGEAGLLVDERECQRAGTSYLFDTLVSLGEDFPGSRLYFVLGSDSFNTLASWHRWRELLDLCHWVVVARPGWELDVGPELRAQYEKRVVDEPRQLKQGEAGESGRIWLAEPSPLQLSSTRIREKLAQNQSLRYLIPDPVIAYIRQHTLYT